MMSSKKKYVTVGLPWDVYERLKQAAKEDYRSKGVMVEKILREHFKMPWESWEGEREKINADNS